MIQCGGRHVFFWSIQYVNPGPVRPRSCLEVQVRKERQWGRKTKIGEWVRGWVRACAAGENELELEN